MEQVNNYDFGLNDANERMRKKKNGNVSQLKKCNQCGYASSRTGNLRIHLKMHSGEKSHKCNQCDFVSTRAGRLSRHLTKHKR